MAFVTCVICKARIQGRQNLRKHLSADACALSKRGVLSTIQQHEERHQQPRNIPHNSPSSTPHREFRYKCVMCSKNFVTRREFNFHIRSCKAKPTIRSYNCRECRRKGASVTFTNRRDLLRHIMREHHREGRGSEPLQPLPWEGEVTQNAPWLDNEGNVIDGSLMETYQLHRSFILRKHDIEIDLGDSESIPPMTTRRRTAHNIMHRYNFPVGGRGLVDDIDFSDQLTQIFQTEKSSFKTNISFGIILRHIETGEYRYFVPSHNVRIFKEAVLIQSLSKLKRFIRKIHNMNVEELILRVRLNTKWRAVMITNVVYDVYLTSFVLGSSLTILPRWLRMKRSLLHLKDTHADNFCVFRCLYYHRHRNNLPDFRRCRKLVRKWFRIWKRVKKLNATRDTFEGLVVPDDVPLFEKTFNVRINVFMFVDEGYSCAPLYLNSSLKDCDANVTSRLTGAVMNLNCYDGHLNYIKNLALYTKRYVCEHCNKCFGKQSNLKRHWRLHCETKTTLKFPGGFHHKQQNIFDKIETLSGVIVAKQDRMFDYFIMIDGEALLLKTNEIDDDPSTRLISCHHPISISVCSNVPGYEEAKCFVSSNITELFGSVVDYMTEISNDSCALTKQKLHYVFRKLHTSIEEQQSACSVSTDDNTPIASHLHKAECAYLKQLEQLEADVLKYCRQIPVLGFNSSKYDLNLWKTQFAKSLNIVDNKDKCYVLKRQNQYSCIATELFKILDVSTYLPAGTNYAKFLSTFSVDQKKGYFCYEWLDDESKLSHTQLPSIDCFYSNLKGCNTLEDVDRRLYNEAKQRCPEKDSETLLKELKLDKIPNTIEENYAYIQQVWRSYGMSTMKDFLIWYNNLDVKPGIEAITRLKEFYWSETEIDIFKEAVSAPGVARILLFRSVEANFSLFDLKNRDLYEVIRKSLCGGPSVIFCRRHEKDKTRLRSSETGKFCRNCIGHDCNALYLYCLGQEQPVSHYVRWLPDKKQKGFVSIRSDKYTIAYDWLDWLCRENDIEIDHKMNLGREKRIGPFLVDGFHRQSDTVYEFYGCYWHQCVKKTCSLYHHEDGPRLRYERTLERERYIKSKGFTIVSMWECTFRNLCKVNDKLKGFIAQREHAFTRKYKSGNTLVTESKLLKAVKNNEFFGLMEVNIQVPHHLYSVFAEMSPLFATCKVPFSAIGSHMQEYVKSSDISESDRLLLVGGMKAEHIMLATPLLQWYLNHGLIVSKVHQAVEYGRARCFKPFMDKVTESRRMGDVDANRAVISELWKIIGNSAYGSLLLDKRKYQNCNYVRGEHQAKLRINDSRFVSLSPLGDEYYEVMSSKKKITMNLPYVLGFYILQYAKQRMLEYYFDFLNIYIDRSNFQLLQMDTDSLYYAISAVNLSDVIRSEKRELYERMLFAYCDDNDIAVDAKMHFLPRQCCEKHAKHDKRTPGLFKLESEGSEMVSLNSKTYALKRSTGIAKVSCKGLNKMLVSSPLDSYNAVLDDQQTRGVINTGIKVLNNSLYTYKQQRWGLSYFYCKRQVQEDGVSTIPLNIVLRPADKDDSDDYSL